MEEKEKRGGSGRLIAVAVLLGTVLTLAVAYVGLCIYLTTSQIILPGTYASGVDLSGMTTEQAIRALDSSVASAYSGVQFTLVCGDSTETLNGSLVKANSQLAVSNAWAEGRSDIFLKRGAVILAHLMGTERQIDLPVELSAAGEEALQQALDRLTEQESVPLVETIWTVEDNTLVIVRGITGYTVERDGVREQLLQAVQEGRSRVIECRLVSQEPTPLDFQAVYDALYIAPQDAYVDEETCTVAPHVVGVSFDMDEASRLFESTPEGGTLRVELIETVPEVTQEQLEALLFADVLGQCTTDISGTSNRLNNVIVAAEAIHNTILMPGQVFSYNDVVGPRTTARGYLPAPAYVGGKTVDEVGGGICQDSSTLYLAALLANLKIVERTNHMYAVGYVPDGMDATVSWGAIDFKFENSTPYPIRIEATVSGRTITVVLRGTKTDDTTVKMTNKTISTNPAETVYKEDPSVPRGTTVVDVTAYNGRKVEAYRNLYDGAGNLISSTLESTNNYRRRDKVVLYNPADAVSLGLAEPPAQDPSQSTVLPVVPPDPDPTPDPNPEPDPTPDPPPTPAPGEPAPEFQLPGMGDAEGGQGTPEE